MKKHAAIEPGTVFGYLTVVNHLGSNKHGQAMYGCRCVCGKWGLPVAGYKLRRGEAKSCGCKRVELRAVTMAETAKATGEGTRGMRIHDGESVNRIDTIGESGATQRSKSNSLPSPDCPVLRTDMTIPTFSASPRSGDANR